MKEFFCTVFFYVAVSITACNHHTQNKTGSLRDAITIDTLISNDSDHIETKKDSSDEKLIFKATGNEPFWGISISKQAIRFNSLAEGFSTFTAGYVEPLKAMDANVKMYHSVSEDGEIKVQIFQGPCTDNMSGEKKNYKTSIEIKRTADKDYKTFTGCGEYITEYRLYDIWVLKQVGGKPVQLNLYGREFPRIEINTKEKTFMAFTGTKEIQGKIFMEENAIKFNTYKEAPGLNKAEKDFLEKLRSVNSFKLEGNHLLLYKSGLLLLKFQKVD